MRRLPRLNPFLFLLQTTRSSPSDLASTRCRRTPRSSSSTPCSIRRSSRRSTRTPSRPRRRRRPCLFERSVSSHLATRHPNFTTILLNSTLYTWFPQYGFHGLSYASVLRSLASHLDKPEKEVDVVVCHLGSGGSVCLIEKGRSVDTSMGLTPLEGQYRSCGYKVVAH